MANIKIEFTVEDAKRALRSLNNEIKNTIDTKLGGSIKSANKAFNKLGTTGNSELDSLIRSAKGVEKQLKATGRSGSKMGSDIAMGANNADKSMLDLLHTARNTAKYLAIAFAVSKVVEFTESLLDATSMLDKYQKILEVISSKEEAPQYMEYIKEFALNTPNDIESVTKAFVKLKSYGLDPTDGTLRVLGDTASGMGKNINMAVEAIVDAMVNQNERLLEFSIRANNLGEKTAYSYADKFGKMKTIIVKNNRDIIKSTLLAIWSDKYGGAMKAMSTTWEATLTNVATSWKVVQARIGNETGFYDFMVRQGTSLMNYLNGSLGNNIVSFFVALSDDIKSTFTTIKDVFGSTTDTANESQIGYWREVQDWKTTTLKGLESLLIILGGKTTSAFLSATSYVARFIPIIGTYASTVIKGIQKVVPFVSAIAIGLVVAFQDPKRAMKAFGHDAEYVFTYVKDIALGTIKFIGGLWNRFSSWTSELWVDVEDSFGKGITSISEMFPKLTTFIGDSWEVLGNSTNSLIEFMSLNFGGFGDWVGSLFGDIGNSIYNSLSEVFSWFSDKVNDLIGWIKNSGLGKAISEEYNKAFNDIESFDSSKLEVGKLRLNEFKSTEYVRARESTEALALAMGNTNRASLNVLENMGGTATEVQKFNESLLSSDIVLKDAFLGGADVVKEMQDAEKGRAKQAKLADKQAKKTAKELARLAKRANREREKEDKRLAKERVKAEKKALDEIEAYRQKLNDSIGGNDSAYGREQSLNNQQSNANAMLSQGEDSMKVQAYLMNEWANVALDGLEKEREKTELLNRQVEKEREKTDLIVGGIIEVVSTIENSLISSLTSYGNGDTSLEEALSGNNANLAGALMSSGNPYAMAVGAFATVVSGAMQGYTDVAENQNKDNKSIVNSMNILESVANPSLAFTRQIATNTRLMAILLDKTGYLASSSGDDFRSGFDSDYSTILGSGSVFSEGTFYNSLLTGVSNAVYNTSSSIEQIGIQFGNATVGSFIDGATNTLGYANIKEETNMLFGLLNSSSSNLRNFDVDPKISQQLARTLEYGVSNIIEQASMLGISDIESSISDIQIERIRISTDGKSAQEITDALSAELGAILDDVSAIAVKNIVDFRQGNEGDYELLTRVAQGYAQARSYLQSEGFAYIATVNDISNKGGNVFDELIRTSLLMEETNVDGTFSNIGTIISQLDVDGQSLVATYSSLIDAQRQYRFITASATKDIDDTLLALFNGDVKALVNTQNDYIDNFMTSTERYNQHLGSITSSFSDLGYTLPTTKDAFRALVESASSTEEYVALINLANQYNDIKEEEAKLLEDGLIVNGTTVNEELTKLIDAKKLEIDTLDKQETATQKLLDTKKSEVDTYDKLTSSLVKSKSSLSDLIMGIDGSLATNKGASDTRFNTLRGFNEANANFQTAVSTGDETAIDKAYSYLDKYGSTILSTYTNDSDLLASVRGVLVEDQSLVGDRIQKVEVLSTPLHEDLVNLTTLIEQLTNDMNVAKDSLEALELQGQTV